MEIFGFLIRRDQRILTSDCEIRIITFLRMGTAVGLMRRSRAQHMHKSNSYLVQSTMAWGIF